MTLRRRGLFLMLMLAPGASFTRLSGRGGWRPPALTPRSATRNTWRSS
jgi:hypothetical protein